MTSSSRTTTGSRSSAAFPARPAICAARRSTAATCSKARAERISEPAAANRAMPALMYAAGRQEPRLSSVPGAGRQSSATPTPIPKACTLGACEYCGHCERFGCEANAKASPHSTILPVLRPIRSSSCARTPTSRKLVYDKAGQEGEERDAISTPATARNTNSRPASCCSAPTCSTTCSSCCSPASASRTIPRPARASSARTTATRSNATAPVPSSRTRRSTPFMAARRGMGVVHRRLQRRQLRPRRARLLRRRLDLLQVRSNGRADRRRARCRPARRAGAANGSRRPRSGTITSFGICARAATMRTARISRPRPDLQGRARPAADPHDLQSSTTTTTKCRRICGGVLERSRPR